MAAILSRPQCVNFVVSTVIYEDTMMSHFESDIHKRPAGVRLPLYKISHRIHNSDVKLLQVLNRVIFLCKIHLISA